MATPSRPPPRCRLGEMLLARGRVDEAAEQFDPALRRNPGDARALLGMARVETARGQLAQGRDRLRRTVELAPKVKAARALLAAVEGRMGNAAAAALEQRRVAALPEDVAWPDAIEFDARQLRTGRQAAIDGAKELFKLGRPADALPQLRWAAEQYPDSADVMLTLGRAFLLINDLPSAEGPLRSAVRLDPKSVAAQVELGNALFAAGRYADAEACFGEAARLGPAQAEPAFNLGMCRSRRGDWTAAVGHWRQAVRLKPDLAQAWLFLADGLRRLGQRPEALSAADRAHALNPDDRQAAALRDFLRPSGAPAPVPATQPVPQVP